MMMSIFWFFRKS